MDICSNAMDLWNFTYVQSGDDLRKLSFNRNGEIIFLDAKDNQIQLKCYSGEPQLEKLMENGKECLRISNITRKGSENRWTMVKLLAFVSFGI